MRSHARVTRILIGLFMAGMLAVVGAGTAQAATVSNASRTALTAAPGFYADGTWRFNVAGTWQVYQSNGATVTLAVTQYGRRFHGTASYAGATGVIEQGSVDGPRISFTIRWSNGERSQYLGYLTPGRYLIGIARDLTGSSDDPSSQATWYTSRVF